MLCGVEKYITVDTPGDKTYFRLTLKYFHVSSLAFKIALLLLYLNPIESFCFLFESSVTL